MNLCRGLVVTSSSLSIAKFDLVISRFSIALLLSAINKYSFPRSLAIGTLGCGNGLGPGAGLNELLRRSRSGVSSHHAPTGKCDSDIDCPNKNDLESACHVRRKSFVRGRGIYHLAMIDSKRSQNIYGGNHHPIENRRPGPGLKLFRSVIERLEQATGPDIEVAIRHNPKKQAIVIKPVESNRRHQHVQ